ncbi:MAG: bifunctional DNA-formamidopyrimidine glycosylase/DNA-(apurinic or apyrimidinic site) lyase [Pseudonocardia sp.]|nr:bifunctional DNA-formamidopyrimidine glycosylase/DNA-(apurinic or apyrimidinic site) lyase [Pseudonocardia sp.]
MPELPEVEVVRRGLTRHVVDRTIARVDVAHPRAVRRHLEGGDDFAARLVGRTIAAARRRGKYLWLELDGGGPDVPNAAFAALSAPNAAFAALSAPNAAFAASRPGGDAVLAHLGMSGQMLVAAAGRTDEKHLRIRIVFDDTGPELRFVDQRTFGGLSVHTLVPAVGGDLLPAPVAHIARDPMDPAFSLDDAVAAIRRRRTELKRALLDQTAVSGIGNIYADEALWRARLHGSRPTEKLTRAQGRAVLTAAAEVMDEALAQGGTSFDALYVNVNGASGYFDRSLAAYGQADRPCPRCGTPIRREPFMNRGSFSCPRCQPRPRRPAL